MNRMVERLAGIFRPGFFFVPIMRPGGEFPSRRGDLVDGGRIDIFRRGVVGPVAVVKTFDKYLVPDRLLRPGRGSVERCWIVLRKCCGTKREKQDERETVF